MSDEKIALERFRKIVIKAHQKGEEGLLIWKNSEEREKWGGNEEEICIEKMVKIHGYDQDGKVYGTYRNIELTKAIRNAFENEYQFKLPTVDGKSIAAMAFQIERLLSIEGHLIFACRGMLYGHLNGPIVSIPSYKLIE